MLLLSLIILPKLVNHLNSCLLIGERATNSEYPPSFCPSSSISLSRSLARDLSLCISTPGTKHKTCVGLGCPEVQVPLKWVNCFARARFLRIALRIHVRADQPIDDEKKETASALSIVQVLGVIVTSDRRLGIRDCASRFAVFSLPHLSLEYFFDHRCKIIYKQFQKTCLTSRFIVEK